MAGLPTPAPRSPAGSASEEHMKVWVDGSPAAVAYVTEDSAKNIKQLKDEHTNNEAEYLAIIEALKIIGTTEILSDSQLVVNQINGVYAIKEPRLRYYCSQVWLLCKHKPWIKFTWIPRKENKAGKLLG